MLGGDNMDLSLARHLKTQVVGKPGDSIRAGGTNSGISAVRQKRVPLAEPEGSEHTRSRPDGCHHRYHHGTRNQVIADTLKGNLAGGDSGRFFPPVAVEDTPKTMAGTDLPNGVSLKSKTRR